MYSGDELFGDVHDDFIRLSAVEAGCRKSRDLLKEQSDIAQAKIDVAEGGLIGMFLGVILMFALMIVGCIFVG